MNPDEITFESTGERSRQADYMARSGCPVFPDDPLPGAMIVPSSTSLLPSQELLVEPHDGDNLDTCDFCNHETAYRERGLIPADYELYTLSGGVKVTETCVSCISEVHVVEYDYEHYEIDDVGVIMSVDEYKDWRGIE